MAHGPAPGQLARCDVGSRSSFSLMGKGSLLPSPPLSSQECGIPKHFGLFYAMGTALMMEGLLSACYHVCPNYTNFQFGEFCVGKGWGRGGGS